MSVHGASHMKCVACDAHVSLEEARSQWWICTTCGSYMCPSCRALFLETGTGTCPGTIVRGVEAHPPHFTRFLGLQRDVVEPDSSERSKVILLGDVQRRSSHSPGGRVVFLDDDTKRKGEQNEVKGQES
ncbi:MAG: hypothetical protein ACFE89_03285 [Candidatus Hodarchaeota archaeon]